MCNVNTDNKTDRFGGRFPCRLFLRTVFHCFMCVLSAVVVTWGCWRTFTITEEQTKNLDIASLKNYVLFFFTNWNYAFQSLFLCLSLTHDVLEWLDKHESRFGTKLRYWRDVLFCGLVVPFTLFVSAMFWSVYAIDRELVFPKIYDTIVPSWFNHCVHTNISIVIAVETILQSRRYPINRALELSIGLGLAILYAAVYYTIFFLSGRWLYPLFGIMTWWQVCLFQCGIWFSVYIFYEIQFPINRLIHKEPQKPIEQGREMQKGLEETQENGIHKNGVQNVIERNSLQNTNPDLKTPPFSTKSWSLKYRSIREQFENSRL
ncbi:androgen-dependent TFPI-regulating protein-like isoform X2 [Achroia grisella]|uniref:androgen-dependent TFPI-regulating protein-like isoform X2 n=1 Tax=Achroia grisella TaxID=688607 RepID=UPI0027D279F0|nr:androgen-dependent TFPI-regulating protein-like isoform X2 [Achroia grisella]